MLREGKTGSAVHPQPTGYQWIRWGSTSRVFKAHLTLKRENLWLLCCPSFSCNLCIKSFTWSDREAVIRGSARCISSTKALTSVLKFTKRRWFSHAESRMYIHYVESGMVAWSTAFIKCQEHHHLYQETSGGRGIMQISRAPGQGWKPLGCFHHFPRLLPRAGAEGLPSLPKEGQGSQHELLLIAFSSLSFKWTYIDCCWDYDTFHFPHVPSFKPVTTL